MQIVTLSRGKEERTHLPSLQHGVLSPKERLCSVILLSGKVKETRMSMSCFLFFKKLLAYHQQFF